MAPVLPELMSCPCADDKKDLRQSKIGTGKNPRPDFFLFESQ
jgi:hypothetical protein